MKLWPFVAFALSWPLNGALAATQYSTGVAGDTSVGSVVTMGVNPAGNAQALGVDPCSGTKSSVAINITSATTTSLIAVSGTTAIYVCGFTFTISQVVTTANTLYFEYGTSTNCTGTHALTGLFGAGGVTAGAPILIASNGDGGHAVISAPAANGICAVTVIGATGSFQGTLTYVQQ